MTTIKTSQNHTERGSSIPILFCITIDHSNCPDQPVCFNLWLYFKVPKHHQECMQLSAHILASTIMENTKNPFLLIFLSTNIPPRLRCHLLIRRDEIIQYQQQNDQNTYTSMALLVQQFLTLQSSLLLVNLLNIDRMKTCLQKVLGRGQTLAGVRRDN